MNLKEIWIKDFMSMGEVEITFQDGIISVNGVNKDVIGASSNGSGKSVLFDAIVWALYGKTIRPIGSDDVIRRGMDTAIVTLFVEKATSTYCITRTRGAKANLEINISENNAEPRDLTQGTPSITQGKLDEIIGMDYKTFLSVATFDLDALRFARATDKEQKEILERLLSLDIYNLALERTRKEMASKEKDLTGVTAGIGFLNQNIASYTKELEGFRTSLANHLVSVDAETKLADIKIVSHEKAIVECQKVIVKGNSDIITTQNMPVTTDTAAITVQQDKIANNEIAIAAIELEIKTLQQSLVKENIVDPAICEKLQDAKLILTKLDMQLQAVRKNKLAYEKHIEHAEQRLGQPCKECSRPITEKELGGVLENYSTEVLKLMEEEAEIQSEYVNREIDYNNINEVYASEYQKTVDAMEDKQFVNNKIAVYQKNIGMHRLEMRSAENGISILRQAAQKEVNNKVLVIQQDVGCAQRNKSLYEQQIIQVKHALELFKSRVSQFESSMADVQKRLDGNAAKLKEEDIKVNLASEEIVYLKYWEKAFSYQGIRAVLLDDVAAKLTEKANEYLKEMMGGTLWIDCHTQSTNKDGEKRERFEVQTFNSFGAGTYYGNSKGEQQRIDIALSLALHDIARTRSASPIGFTIFDEVFERLDEAGCDSIIRLLHKERSNFGTVFVVSHNPNLTIRFPKTLEFVKQNGITSLAKKEILCEELKPESTKTEKTTMPSRKVRTKKISTPKVVV